MKLDLALAAARNLAVHFTWVQARLPTMRAVVADDLVLADCGFDCDTFNAVACARLADSTASDRVGAAIDWFQGRPFSWWVAPLDRPADLGDLLRAAGLEAAEGELAMSCALELVDHTAGLVRGLEIRPVRSADEVATFARLLAALFDPPDDGVLRFYREAVPVLLDPGCPLRLYLGWLDGVPVATAERAMGGGVVGLYNISTRPDHRGLGIGSAMTRAPLAAARDEGHTHAILQAAPAGVGIYTRVGFQTFGEVVEYKPPAR